MCVAGELDKAAEHYEIFHELTVGQTWQDENCCLHFTHACTNLWRIYTSLADEKLESAQDKEAREFLRKAYDIAKEGECKVTFSVPVFYMASLSLDRKPQ